MVIRVEQHVRTEMPAGRVLDLIEKEIRTGSITTEVERDGDRLTTRQVIGGPTGTGFWIYRDERTVITVEPAGGGYRCLAAIDYRPSSAFHWAVWITGIVSVFGWIQPVFFYHKQKGAVRRFFEELFQAVTARLRSDDLQGIEAYLAQGEEPAEEESDSEAEASLANDAAPLPP